MGDVVNLPMSDSLRSLVAGLGTDRDKMFGTSYGSQYLTDQQLFDAYRFNWMPGKIVDIPAEDSVAEGRDWQAEQDQIELIEAEEKRLGLWQKLLEVQIKARLWGGAAIFIGTGDQDLAEPLNPESIKKGGIKYLTVLSRRECVAGDLDQDPNSETYHRPAYYEVTGQGQFVRIHPSRMVIQAGRPHVDSDLVAGPTRGWGDSVLDRVYTAIRNADATAANIASLVFEANVDVFGVPDMMASLSDPDYEQRLINRFTLSATAKGINKALIRDAAEEYERKQVSFANLPEVLQKFLEIAAGAADIPLTRFLGTAPSGLGSNGDHSMQMYHKRIATQQKLVLSPALYRLDECLIRSALGNRPPEIFYQWSPLEQMTEKEQAEVGKTQAETTEIYGRIGCFTGEELRKAATNQIVETGIYPGFDQIVAETGAEFDLGADPRDVGTVNQQATADAAPRSLYIRRDVINAAEIRAWAKSQGFETVQHDLHVTIMHTRTPLDWIKVGSGDEWREEEEFKISAGGPRLMERFGDAVVLQFASSRLTWRREDIKRMGANTDHPDYQPHVTISWDAANLDLSQVEPYRGPIILGPEIFEEINEDWRSGVIEDGGVPAGYGPFVDAYNPSQPRGKNGRRISSGERLTGALDLAGSNSIVHVEFAKVKRPAELSKLVGQDVRGFKHAASNQAMQHVLKKHGNASSEAKRGQKAVTAADFGKLQSIVKAGTYVSALDRPFGPRRVQIVSEVDGDRFTYVGEVRAGKRRIDMISLWKK